MVIFLVARLEILKSRLNTGETTITKKKTLCQGPKTETISDLWMSTLESTGTPTQRVVLNRQQTGQIGIQPLFVVDRQ